ncbi:class F sortase [Actinomycetospora chibensis]|uniref:Class F sortase n=1 Tax=Actinomycetospora chibensis TaxID=663606 RepID=A0ABV9RSX2_9PSEU|nr:class F sortase [Actinomycetospora chibensis]MDD7922295.1 class F sortase [Actinomycetospora chibensis]
MSALTGVVVGALLLLAGAVWPAVDPVSRSSSSSAVAAVSDPAPPPRVTGTTSTTRPEAPPVGLRIPDLGVDVPVVPVGVDRASGGMEIPEDVATVGWYRYGPGFDAVQGSTVLAGHVDRAGQEGALFDLRELEPGATLAVAGPDGQVRSYAVASRDQWSKDRVPLERLFARTGAPRLVVITCGGPFDEATRSYRDNVVITAVPTGGP